MRSRIVVTLFALFLVGSKYANAQSINGFTSIDFDYSSNTIIGYCETDIDYELQGEYEARVDCSITNNSTGSEIVALWGDDAGGYNGFTSVLLEVPGTPGTEYTATGGNYAVAILIAQEDPYYLYWDTDNFEWFAFQGVYQPMWYSFYGPGPELTRRQPAMSLGATVESATLSTPPAGPVWGCIAGSGSSWIMVCKYACVPKNGDAGAASLSIPEYRIQKACPYVTGNSCPYYLEVNMVVPFVELFPSYQIVSNSCTNNPK